MFKEGMRKDERGERELKKLVTTQKEALITLSQSQILKFLN